MCEYFQIVGKQALREEKKSVFQKCINPLYTLPQIYSNICIMLYIRTMNFYHNLSE